MTGPLVVVDADALGRERTGDETYVEGLLGALPAVAEGLRVAAVTRCAELVPPGIEPLELPARSQELRMALSLPRLLRRMRPALAHFLHVVPPGCPCPAVLTIQDLSFERDPSVLRPWERLVFRRFVPWSARRAAKVIAISERTQADARELYGVDGVVTPLGVDAAFAPGAEPNSYLLVVGSVERRKNPLAAAAAARELGRSLVVVGPVRDEALARELRARSRPAATSRSRSASARRTPSASAVGSTKTAASPATSRSAASGAATTGVPEAIASTSGSPNPS